MTDPSGQSPTSRVCISNPVLSFLGPFISGLGQKSYSGALAHASLSGEEGKILKTLPHSDLLPKTSPLWALLHTSPLYHLRVCKKCQSPFVPDSLHSKMTLTCALITWPSVGAWFHGEKWNGGICTCFDYSLLLILSQRVMKGWTLSFGGSWL